VRLDFVFIMHALSSLIFALLLFFVPSELSDWLTGHSLTPAERIFPRLYAGCLVLIAHATFRATLAYSYYARHLVLWVMLVQQLLGMAICFTFYPFTFAFWFSFLFFLIFAVGYLIVLWFYPGDI